MNKKQLTVALIVGFFVIIEIIFCSKYRIYMDQFDEAGRQVIPLGFILPLTLVVGCILIYISRSKKK